MIEVKVHFRAPVHYVVTLMVSEGEVNNDDAIREAVLATLPDLSYEEAQDVTILDWTD